LQTSCTSRLRRRTAVQPDLEPRSDVCMLTSSTTRLLVHRHVKPLRFFRHNQQTRLLRSASSRSLSTLPSHRSLLPPPPQVRRFFMSAAVPQVNAAAASAAATSTDSKGLTRVTPLKSAQDKREYRVITLPNKLQAVLVHDPETDKVMLPSASSVLAFGGCVLICVFCRWRVGRRCHERGCGSSVRSGRSAGSGPLLRYVRALTLRKVLCLTFFCLPCLLQNTCCFWAPPNTRTRTRTVRT
jgi:hypothetical protein